MTALLTRSEEQLEALELMQARLDHLEELAKRHEMTIQALIRWTPEDSPEAESDIDTKLLNASSKTPAVVVWPTERNPASDSTLRRTVEPLPIAHGLPLNVQATTPLIQTLIEANHSAIIGLDATGHVRLWNPMAERMFGWTLVELLNEEPPFFTAKQAEQFGWLIRPDAAVIPFEHVVAQFTNKLGDTVEGTVDSQPSECGGVLLTITPIDNSPIVQPNPQPATRSLAIDQLISGVAHDLDHLLAMLMTQVDQLCEVEGLPMTVCDQLDEIHAHHHMAAQLTQQLAKLIRRVDSNDQRTHLSNHLSQLRPLLLTLCGEAIRLDLTIEDDLIHPGLTPGDFDQLVLNLCLNACNAMPNGGTLSLQLCELEQSNRPLFLLLAGDTGGGLSIEQRDVLLHSFKNDTATTPGYGLAIVQQIARQVGGHVELDAEPGMGTQVRVYLPV